MKNHARHLQENLSEVTSPSIYMRLTKAFMHYYKGIIRTCFAQSGAAFCFFSLPKAELTVNTEFLPIYALLTKIKRNLWGFYT